MKINPTKLRRDAYDCRYSHMVMEPSEIMALCDEIMKLRTKVSELGGDPFDLDDPPAATASLSVEETQRALGADSAIPVDALPADPLGVAQTATYIQSLRQQIAEEELAPKEEPQPAETEQEPTHTNDSEQQ